MREGRIFNLQFSIFNQYTMNPVREYLVLCRKLFEPLRTKSYAL